MGDDADNPRFVETRPRRGYRFIAPVNKPIPQLAPQLATIVPPKTPSAWFSSRWTWLGVANCARPWIGRLTVVSWRFRREAQTSFTPGFPCFGFPIRSRALSYPLRNRSLTSPRPSHPTVRKWFSPEGVSAVWVRTCSWCPSPVASPNSLLSIIPAYIPRGLRMAKISCSLPIELVSQASGAFPLQEEHHSRLPAWAREHSVHRFPVKGTSSFINISSKASLSGGLTLKTEDILQARRNL